MLIKKIEMKNFRQFFGVQAVEFAFDQERNITIVMGENGSGKTTLAQAFLWVLYGDTEFKIKEVINRNIRDNMIQGDREQVRVSLYLNFEGFDYTISRKQIFVRESKRVRAGSSQLTVAYSKGGQQEFLEDEHKCNVMIKKMLPKALSKFFFFDGERIKTMSDEIQNGKSREFANAVEGLVGLTAIKNAIEHMKPKQTNSSVIGRYNNKIDDGGNEKVKQYGVRIKKLESELLIVQNRIDEIAPQIDYYNKQIVDLRVEIASFAEAEQLKEQYNKLVREIDSLKKTKNESIRVFLKNFNRNTNNFVTKPLIARSLNQLSKEEVIDKGIPYMHQKTVDYLIKRGVCICGNPVHEGSEGYEKLYDLIDYLPPKSIGTMVNQFVNTSELKIKQSETYYDTFENLFKSIRKNEKQIKSREDKLTEIETSLTDTSKVSALRKKRSDATSMVSNLQNELNEKNQKLGKIEEEKGRLETKREELVLVDEKNREFNIYRQYALKLYEELMKSYKEKEKETRIKLQKYINEIFVKIYEGGLSLSVDEKYNISVRIDDKTIANEDIERSTAQNYSVIFAFIAGIIQMAKEKSKDSDSSNNDESIFGEAEGYPLVMDAPLSAFDKKRINNICDTLPKIAQQVVMFIKDTDGDIAEEHLSSKIGSKYYIAKETLTKSKITKR